MKSLAIAGLLVMFAAGFAHYEIPKLTYGAGHRLIAHLVLLAVGCACGVVSLPIPVLNEPRWLVFATAFGIVHVPAAAILLIKRWRGLGPS